jgi:1,2-diacylglycerol 3-beta-galactosyltransferase
MRQVLAFFSDAGGGHRNAVKALLDAAEETRPPFRLVPRNLSETLAAFDLLRRFGRRSIEETYNELLRSGRTTHLVPLLRLLHAAAWLLHRPMVRALARQLADERPAAVLSVHPNFNALLRDATRRALPGAPFLVLMTDYADFPPHFWIEPGVDRLIVGSAEARAQALQLGLPAGRVTQSSGMVLNPRFHRVDQAQARVALRAELALPPRAFVVLLLFGGKGAAEMAPLAEALLQADPDWYVVAICGKNAPLQGQLAGLAAGAPRLRVTGFTERVADFMAACDLLLTKPGPGSLAEAFQLGLPPVVTCNSRTIPQERHNAEMLASSGLGLVVHDWRELPSAAARVAREPGLHARLRAAIAALPPNRAVYEALDTVARELAAATPTPP